MAFLGLQDFVAYLDKRGALRRISVPVAADYEMTAIVERLAKTHPNPPALLFEDVAGSAWPVLVNTYGTAQRVSWALGLTNLDQLASRFADLITPSSPRGLSERLSKLGETPDLLRYKARLVRTGLSQTVVKDAPNFGALPQFKMWPQDSGASWPMPLVIIRNPVSEEVRWCTYPVLFGADNTAVLVGFEPEQSEVAQLVQAGEAYEVAVVLGGDPALLIFAAMQLPPDVPVTSVVGALRKNRVELVRAKTLAIEVPVEAEIILEGQLDPRRLVNSGPLVLSTGYLTPARPRPAFELTAITHRTEPIVPLAVPTRLPNEASFLQQAAAQVLLPLAQLLAPEITGLSLPAAGIGSNLAIVAIKKQYAGQAQKVMHALWGMSQLMRTKIIAVVNDDCDLNDPTQVAHRLAAQLDPAHDLTLFNGPTATGFGGKLGIDATRKLPTEAANPVQLASFEADPTLQEQIEVRWSRYGLS